MLADATHDFGGDANDTGSTAHVLLCVGDAAHDYGDPAHESVDASCGCGDTDHECSALMADHDFGDTAHL